MPKLCCQKQKLIQFLKCPMKKTAYAFSAIFYPAKKRSWMIAIKTNHPTSKSCRFLYQGGATTSWPRSRNLYDCGFAACHSFIFLYFSVYVPSHSFDALSLSSWVTIRAREEEAHPVTQPRELTFFGDMNFCDRPPSTAISNLVQKTGLSSYGIV
jgi:hypothetical protein